MTFWGCRPVPEVSSHEDQWIICVYRREEPTLALRFLALAGGIRGCLLLAASDVYIRTEEKAAEWKLVLAWPERDHLHRYSSV